MSTAGSVVGFTSSMDSIMHNDLLSNALDPGARRKDLAQFLNLLHHALSFNFPVTYLCNTIETKV
jgi:hypothetical protein